MKQCVLVLLVFVSVHGAPAGILPPSSCKDATTVRVAGEALNKINQDRTAGYVFSLERVSNVHQTHHGETGVVFYLTIDVLETKCHVLSKKSYKECEGRNIGDNPVYGQCKAVIYVNKPQSVSRLYKYTCTVRPVSPTKINQICPDCPTRISLDNKKVEKTMKMGLEKFNKESGLLNYFVLLNITRAISELGLLTMYSVEFTIHETDCSNKTALSEVSRCNIKTCEFAHKGFCRSTHSVSNGDEFMESNCEIYEPQAAAEEKKNHMQTGEVDHHHKNTHDASHSHDHTQDHIQDHDHAADHKPEGEHDHDDGKAHGHPQTHEQYKSHGPPHSHEDSHDHVHAHHDQAHNHTQDQGVHPAHHNYGHTEGQTHEHDHELALDHEHKHGHLHEHEHHHHHHSHHAHETTVRKPEGTVQVLPSLDEPMTHLFFHDQDEEASAQTPGQTEPIIGKFPKTLSPNCPAEFQTNDHLIQNAFAEDPVFVFKPAA